jgi:cytochrome c-type biogenesis protein CcmH/NrfG
VRIDPTYAAPLLGLGRIYLARRTFGASLRELEKAAALAPENAEVFAMMGDAHYELGAYPKAIDAYKDSLTRAASPETMFKLGRAYSRNDSPQTAETLRRATDKAPAGAIWLPEALRLLGYHYRSANKRAEMCTTFAKYLAVAPATDILRDEVKRTYAGCQ